VARRAIFGRGLVEHNSLSANYLRQLMTLRAADVLMGAPQRKSRPLLMIEQRRLPLHAVVAFGAARHLHLGELFAMDVLMAVLALCRSGLEVHVHQLGLEVRRLVAINARRRPMGTQQSELCFGVIEAR